MSTPKTPGKQRLRSHFRFSQVPFSKYARAHNMYDSRGQKALLEGLHIWTDVRGIALVTGAPGVGKSITLRRFIGDLDENRVHVVRFAYLPTTPAGFLRSLARQLGLPMRQYASDLFGDVQAHLAAFERDRGPHPLLVVDDAEGLGVETLDLLRRLTCYDLDAKDLFSVLICGTEELMATLRHPALEPLRSRITYAHHLRPFGIEDAREYVRHHLLNADCDKQLFSEDAVRQLFHTSRGCPRALNQLALHVLVGAAVAGRHDVDDRFVKAQMADHPLYQTSQGA